MPKKKSGPTMPKKEFGQATLELMARARELREQQDLTQQAVGERLGLQGLPAAQRVYRFETGDRLGSPELMAELAEVGLHVHRANLWLPPGSPRLEDLAAVILELRALAGAEAEKLLRERGVKVSWLRELAETE